MHRLLKRNEFFYFSHIDGLTFAQCYSACWSKKKKKKKNRDIWIKITLYCMWTCNYGVKLSEYRQDEAQTQLIQRNVWLFLLLLYILPHIQYLIWLYIAYSVWLHRALLHIRIVCAAFVMLDKPSLHCEMRSRTVLSKTDESPPRVQYQCTKHLYTHTCACRTHSACFDWVVPLSVWTTRFGCFCENTDLSKTSLGRLFYLVRVCIV